MEEIIFILIIILTLVQKFDWYFNEVKKNFMSKIDPLFFESACEALKLNNLMMEIVINDGNFVIHLG